MNEEVNWNLKFIGDLKQRPGTWNHSITKSLQNRHWKELSEIYNEPVDTLKRKYSNLRLGLRRKLKKIPQTNNKFDVKPENFKTDWPYYQSMLFLVNEKPKNNKRRLECFDDVVVATPKKVRRDVDVENYMYDDSNDNLPELEIDMRNNWQQEDEVNVDELPDNDMDKSNNNSIILNNSINELPDNDMNKSNNYSIILNNSIDLSNKWQQDEIEPEKIEVVKPLKPNPTDDDSVYHFLMSLHFHINKLDHTRRLYVQSRICDLIREEAIKVADPPLQ